MRRVASRRHVSNGIAETPCRRITLYDGEWGEFKVEGRPHHFAQAPGAKRLLGLWLGQRGRRRGEGRRRAGRRHQGGMPAYSDEGF